jgi:hypothetical protein
MQIKKRLRSVFSTAALITGGWLLAQFLDGVYALILVFVSTVLLIGCLCFEAVKDWWMRPETDHEHERSLGGFWIQMAKVWWRQVWSGNDSNT